MSSLQYSINAQQLIRYICEHPSKNPVETLRAIHRLSDITLDSILMHKNKYELEQKAKTDSALSNAKV